MSLYVLGGSIVMSGGAMGTDGFSGGGFVSSFPFTVTGTVGNGNPLTVSRSSGTFAAKQFGSGSPQLFDTMVHQYVNGVDQNAYSGFTDGQQVTHQLYSTVSSDWSGTSVLTYSTSRTMRTSFDSAMYSSQPMPSSGKTAVGQPPWPGAYGTQNNQTLYVSFWGRCSAPLQGTGGGDSSCKIFRISQQGDLSVRSGYLTADSGGCGYWSTLTPYPGDQGNFETLRSGNANNWYRHETWWDNTTGGFVSSAGQLRNDWSGVMGSGNPFIPFELSSIGNPPHDFEACHPADVMYASNAPANVFWDTATGSPPTMGNIVCNLMGYDDGHALSSGTIYDIAQVYYDPDFQRFEVSDASTWDVSPTSVMNREIQGQWSRNSSTQCTVYQSQGQFASLSGKYLWYVNGRNSAEQVGHWT
jgi:hypothetical protein